MTIPFVVAYYLVRLTETHHLRSLAVVCLVLALVFPLQTTAAPTSPTRTASTPSAKLSTAVNAQQPEASSPNAVCMPLDNHAWAAVAPIPVAASGVGVASDSRYAYAVGGYTTTPVNQVSRYNPSSNLWQTLASLPDAASGIAVVEVGGRLYAFGGYTGGPSSKKTRIYNIVSNTWSYGADMPAGRHAMGIGYYNGKVYLVGGFANPSFGSVQNQTWEYDVQSNSWMTKTNLPAARGGAGYGVINGHLYIAGGADLNGGPQSTVYDYDISSDSWAARASLPTARYAPGSAVRNGQLWIFGGGTPFLSSGAPTVDAPNIDAPNVTLAVTEIYDPIAGSWTFGPPQNVARNLQGGTTIGNQIVSVGGDNSGASANTTEVTGIVSGLRILIVFADSEAPATLQSSLLGLPGVARVDLFDARLSTPSPALLQDYDMIVTWSNEQYANTTVLGNELADFEDAGGVVAAFAFDDYSGYSLDGRWRTGLYAPFVITSTANFYTGTLDIIDVQNSPLLFKVNSLTAYYRIDTTPAEGATQIARWDDFTPLLAVKGRAIGITGYFGDGPLSWSGDVAQIAWNAAFLLRQKGVNCIPTVYLPSVRK